MKRLIYFALVVCCVLPARAQDGDGKLTAPSSPAFSILNFEPAAVLKPTTAKSLAADIANAFDRNGKLLVNLGLEVTPYWMQSRPTLTRQQYLNPSLLQTIKQSLSISAATAKDSASGATRLGTGFRLKVLNGRPVAELSAVERKLIDQETITNALAFVRASIASGAIKSRQDAIEQLMSIINSDVAGNHPPTPEEARRIRNMANKVAQEYREDELTLFIERLMEEQVSSYNGLAHKVSELNYLRKGWIVELAGASAFNPGRGSDLERAGLWGNISNYVSPQDLFSLTSRFMWRHTNDTSVTNFDAGLGYLKQGETYNVSVEALARWYETEVTALNDQGERVQLKDRAFAYRIAVQGSYIITRDLSINVSLGKGFEDAFASTSGFFSILGFNYSIFRKENVGL
jgi:hypothetical protein